MMTGFGMGFGWFGFVFMAIFWVGLIAVAMWLFSNLFPQKAQTSVGNAPESPTTILEKRYARGEISKEEFEAMRQDLEQ